VSHGRVKVAETTSARREIRFLTNDSPPPLETGYGRTFFASRFRDERDYRHRKRTFVRYPSDRNVTKSVVACRRHGWWVRRDGVLPVARECPTTDPSDRGVELTNRRTNNTRANRRTCAIIYTGARTNDGSRSEHALFA